MSVWDKYEQRIEIVGPTRRERAYKRDVREFTYKGIHNLSYHHVTIDDIDQDVMIVTSRNTNQRRIMAMPGETLKLGGLVHWMDNYWLITEKDADTTIYEKALMEQCNHILRWIAIEDGLPVIHEQWSIVTDSTKYMTGELEDRNFIVTRPDARIAVTIARNEYTVKFGRHNRFLIDDPDSPLKQAYDLTKPVKLGHVINGEGIYSFVLQESNSTHDDNHELGIADYYKYFTEDGEIKTDISDGDGEGTSGSTEEAPEENTGSNTASSSGKKGWL